MANSVELEYCICHKIRRLIIYTELWSDQKQYIMGSMLYNAQKHVSSSTLDILIDLPYTGSASSIQARQQIFMAKSVESQSILVQY